MSAEDYAIGYKAIRETLRALGIDWSLRHLKRVAKHPPRAESPLPVYAGFAGGQVGARVDDLRAWAKGRRVLVSARLVSESGKRKAA